MLQGSGAASPQACGTRGGARAAGRTPLPLAPVGDAGGFPVGPAGASGTARRGAPPGEVGSQLRPAAAVRCPSGPEPGGGGRISSQPPLRRPPPRPAALDLHDQKHSRGDAVGVSTPRRHLYFKSCDV